MLYLSHKVAPEGVTKPLTQEVLSCEWYRVRYWMGREPYRGEGSGESWAVPGGVWDSFAFFS